MTEKEKKRLLAKAEKLKPKPTLLPSGAWRCQVQVNGQRVSVTGETPEEAHALALATKEGLVEQSEERAQERAGNITLADAIDLYIKRRENVLSPSTVHGYKEVKRNRFKSIMQIKVCDIDKTDLQEAINEDASKVSSKTIKNALGLSCPPYRNTRPLTQGV